MQDGQHGTCCGKLALSEECALRREEGMRTF